MSRTQTSKATITRQIRVMLNLVDDYEKVKSKTHNQFKTAKEFYLARGVRKQNFLLYYNRYINNGRNADLLLPRLRGKECRYQLSSYYSLEIEAKIISLRTQGKNRYEIRRSLEKDLELGISNNNNDNNNNNKILPSVSSIYRTYHRLGFGKLTPKIKEEKRKIITMSSGELIHIDAHYLPKGVIASQPNKQYYLLGAIDDYSRICWVEVIDKIKALEVAFTTMDIILLLKQRYDITFKTLMSDNGSEFCCKGSKPEDHPFERMLIHFDIKHIKTKPYRPQTNGKIERFWKTIHEDVIEGTLFETIEELKKAVLGYNLYYNEHRIHQGINHQTPLQKLQSK